MPARGFERGRFWRQALAADRADALAAAFCGSWARVACCQASHSHEETQPAQQGDTGLGRQPFRRSECHCITRHQRQRCSGPKSRPGEPGR